MEGAINCKSCNHCIDDGICWATCDLLHEIVEHEHFKGIAPGDCPLLEKNN